MACSVSIIVPTHNRADLLTRTLESLGGVEIPDGTEVELLVVANACTDATAEVVAERARSLPFPVKCLLEPEPNVAVARNAGLRASRGQIIAISDDDVWIEPGWLTGLLEVYANYPADLVAGKVELWWDDTDRPDWFTPRHEAMLSRVDHGHEVIELSRRGDALGANLSWRRDVTDAVGPFIPGLGRTGTRLLGGEETEFVQRALAGGFRMFYAPRSIVKHYVSPERCTPKYLCSLSREQAISLVCIEPSLTRCGAVGKILSGLHQWVSHSLSELWYRLSGDKGQAIYHRARKNTGIGKMIGSSQHLIGRTVVDRFKTAAK